MAVRETPEPDGRRAIPASFVGDDLTELLEQVRHRTGRDVQARETTPLDNVYELGERSLLFVGRFPAAGGAGSARTVVRGVVLDRWTPQQLGGRDHLVPAVDFYHDHDGLLYRAALAYRLDTPLAVHGHTGVGKTELIRYLASLLGAPVYRMNLHGLSTTDDIIGKLLPAGSGEVRFQDGLVTTAVREGGLLLLEEMNATGQEVWFALHGLLDQSRSLVLVEKDNEVVRQHPDCRIFATFNPPEYLTLYPGTKELSAAYLRRWVSVRIGFMDMETERRILAERFPEFAAGAGEDLDAMLEVASLARTMLLEQPNAFPFVLSTGALEEWARLAPHMGPLEAARMTFYDVLDERTKAVFRDQIFAYATPWDVALLAG